MTELMHNANFNPCSANPSDACFVIGFTFTVCNSVGYHYIAPVLLLSAKLRFPFSVVRQNLFHLAPKQRGVVMLFYVRKLVHHNVINRFGRIQHQSARKAYRVFSRARAEPRFCARHRDFCRRNAHYFREIFHSAGQIFFCAFYQRVLVVFRELGTFVYPFEHLLFCLFYPFTVALNGFFKGAVRCAERGADNDRAVRFDLYRKRFP